MSHIFLSQNFSQKLSPQQMQTIKLLHLSEEDMPERIEKEIETNPALEKNEEFEGEQNIKDSQDSESISDADRYNYRQSNYLRDKQDWYDQARENTPKKEGLYEKLTTQLNFLDLPEKEHDIALYLIASLERDGYLRRDVQLLVNDLAFSEYIYTSKAEVEQVLMKIQQFDPPGIAARTLQECLLLQSKRLHLNSGVKHAVSEILENYFDFFVKNKISKIKILLKNTNASDFDAALAVISSLNTKPYIELSEDYSSKDLYPDFIVTAQDGGFNISLYNKKSFSLRVNKSYISILERYRGDKKRNENLKEAAAFAKQNLEKANWFINSLEQRRTTLLIIMNAIVEAQKKFFDSGEISDIKPLIMKDIADKIKMDTSTVSRVVSNKHVKTDNGIYSLKYFFSTGISTTDGHEVSNKEVQLAIKELIYSENKLNPYSDEAIAAFLKEKGYNIARRTVAKYRDSLQIRTSRERKKC